MRPPEISIIIPAFNAENSIPQAIESVLTQTYQDFEILIIDDGSQDETHSVVAKYLKDQRIKYLYQTNQGAAAARNKGTNLARGRYIGFLDSDDVLLPTSIEERLFFLKKFRNVGMVFTDILRIRNKDDSPEIHLKENGFLEAFSNAIVYRNDFYYIFDSSFFDAAIKTHPYIKTPTVLLRSEVLKTVGSFNSSLKAAEDIDLWLRIARHYHIGYIDKPLSVWNNYLSNLTSNHIFLLKETLNYYCSLYKDKKIEMKKETRKALKKKIGKINFTLGYNYLTKLQFSKARNHFIKSFLSSPFKLTNIKCLLLSHLPIQTYLFLKKLKSL